uniref:hypothetical protein n=1 Tax=Prosthecobacter sp. TaxID=1965333 RepID=UPI0037830E4D
MKHLAIESSRSGMFARGFDEGFEVGLPPDEFDLPHPEVHPRVMLLLHQVLGVALEMLRVKHGSLAAFGEDPLTVQIHNLLENDLRQRRARGRADAIPGFDEGIFESVSRHSGATDYTGTKLKEEPDLYFKLKPAHHFRVLATEYAIFTECKPVDAKHGAGSRYCDDGLNRFVDGEYGWAMRDALMIGYARRRSIDAHLSPALRQPKRRAKLGIESLPRPIAGAKVPRAEALHVSTHQRGIVWRWNKGPATPIRVYHSWHDCS